MRPIITIGGAGFCAKIALAARYSGDVVTGKSTATPARLLYVRVRSVHVAEYEGINGTPKPGSVGPADVCVIATVT